MTNHEIARSVTDIMSRRSRFSLTPHWWKGLHVDGGMAEAEGLAAGTGLLTGDLVRNGSVEASPCPKCGGQGDPVVIDLVVRMVTRRCQQCGHRWDTSDAADAPANH